MTKHKKLRILSAGDIHGDQRQVQTLAELAEKEHVDLVILSGDTASFHGPEENLIGPFLKKHKKVLLIPGNHDGFAITDFLAEVYGIKNIHGYSVKYKDVGIFGCGGANVGMEQISDKEIFDLLKKGFDKIKYLDKKIMVTHMHASPSKSEFSGFKGSPGIRKAIATLQPDILLCSHIHEAAGIEEKIGKTRVINVGKKGQIIEI